MKKKNQQPTSIAYLSTSFCFARKSKKKLPRGEVNRINLQGNRTRKMYCHPSDMFRADVLEMEESLDEVEKIFTESIALYKDLQKDFASDIEIICSGVILPGHKYVLSSRCDVLAKILRSGVDQLGKPLNIFLGIIIY